MGALAPAAGTVALVDFGRTVGREQSGVRPGLIISSSDYSDVITTLALAVPCTTVRRGWSNHVEITGPTGLAVPTFALTEQHRCISTERVLRITGTVDNATLSEVLRWVRAWIDEVA
ncbi:MAG: type II toxin-antitoxin system PemK/MazF family toxin [Candidatus Nanopelagicales bacterium]|nr:type II toxin-antitoxin system PemK/MazF family toxin [Candidatus Nanopelagicales bacterium]MCF8537162.1 type II toxin-antitoxin system PemK/MazF family toxin [Candidatus Nanopelagicales bacterium]MCF8556443.1 type II toxin-antitoxin system PemK/MazF family toxin [Candidatus Nanopelagicales bacterium]